MSEVTRRLVLSLRDRILLVGLRTLALGGVLCSAEFVPRPLVITGAVTSGAAGIWLALGSRWGRFPLILAVGLELWFLATLAVVFWEKPSGYEQEAIRLVLGMALIAVAALESSKFAVPESVRNERPSPLRPLAITGSVFVLLLTVQLVGNRWVNQAWNRDLVKASAGADLLVAGGMATVPLRQTRIEGKEEVARFLKHLEVNALWSKDVPPCLCLGDYQLFVIARGRRVLELEVHGRHLRWPGGPWKTDARMTVDAQRLLDSTFRAPYR